MATLQIREATVEDADAIAELLAQLGHAPDHDTVVARLHPLIASAQDHVLVAEDGRQIVGLIGLHVMPLLHRPQPSGRVTALVVRDTARRRGIGRLLMEQAARLFREAGCGRVEVTSNLRRTEAHTFYRSLGFETPSAYFVRLLD